MPPNTKGNAMLFRTVRLAAMLCGLAAPACAQVASPEPMTNCTGVLTATLASERPHPHLNRCWDKIVPEIAQSVRRAPENAHPEYLARVLTYAAPFRDPEVARAALALAEDGGAPASAQMLGWVLAIFQIRPGMYLRSLGSRPEEWLVTDPLSRCDWGEPTDIEYFRDHGLAPGFVGEVEHAAQSVAQDASRPAAVRNYARCVLDLLPTLSADPDAP
jgi:hypothetical protein